MNVLHVNTHDDVGGAAIAMERLHRGLREAGHDSRLLLGNASTREDEVHTIRDVVGPLQSRMERAVERVGSRIEGTIGPFYLSYRSSRRLPDTELFQTADVVHLHNIHGGYFDYRALPRLTRFKPVVWTLNDMWALTGHCSAPFDCTKWRGGCHQCPQLRGAERKTVAPPPTFMDLTRRVWEAKRKVYRKSAFQAVAISQWLARQVEISICREGDNVSCIPHGVDTNVMSPVAREFAREALGIPAGTGLIFYPVPNVGIASKGFSFLVNALDRLHSGQPISLLSVAERGSFRSLAERMPVYEIGRISSDQLLRLAYSAADLLVFPSLAEAQGLVLIESLACGTPVVAFDVGPVHEVVHHMETGYLARHRDPDDLARGISILLSDGELRHRLGRQGRELVINEYSLELEVARYEELYTRSVVSGAACE